MMKHIECACGDLFETKRAYILHILSLGCFDEDLNFKEKDASEVTDE